MRVGLGRRRRSPRGLGAGGRRREGRRRRCLVGASFGRVPSSTTGPRRLGPGGRARRGFLRPALLAPRQTPLPSSPTEDRSPRRPVSTSGARRTVAPTRALRGRGGPRRSCRPLPLSQEGPGGRDRPVRVLSASGSPGPGWKEEPEEAGAGGEGPPGGPGRSPGGGVVRGGEGGACGRQEGAGVGGREAA